MRAVPLRYSSTLSRCWLNTEGQDHKDKQAHELEVTSEWTECLIYNNVRYNAQYVPHDINIIPVLLIFQWKSETCMLMWSYSLFKHGLMLKVWCWSWICRIIGKDLGAGKVWSQKKGAAENEMVRWYHWLNGHEFGQNPGDSGGQGSWACCSPLGRKVRHDLATKQQQNTGT